MFESRKSLEEAAEVFKQKNQSVENIIKAGVICILALYGDPKSVSDLNQYRYQCFKAAIAKNSRVQLKNLPCTIDATTKHLKKVYLQVQLWIRNYLLPMDWGWKSGKCLVPNPMCRQPVSENLLKIICYKCKSGCGGNCGCRKTGLFCTETCFNSVMDKPAPTACSSFFKKMSWKM